MPKSKKPSPDAAEAALPPATCSAVDWESIARKLMHKCIFAVERLQPYGWTGELIKSHDPFETIHWKEDFADAIELVPGVSVDREAMHAMSLPRKQREKFFADRKKAKPNK